jgi:hypothetical protein
VTISNNHQVHQRIHDALTQLTHDINYLTDNTNPRHQEDRAETIARFSNALHTLTIHNYNLMLNPALTEDEEYMRMVCEGYDRDISTQPEPLELETLIWVTNFRTGKHTIQHMQVTGYDATTHRHELTFTLTDGTTHTTIAPYATNLETAILENLRLTEKTLIPKKDFTLRKSKRHAPALCLTIRTTLQ